MKRIKKITGSTLFRVSSLNTVSVVVKILGGLVSSKVIAWFIGPAGLALVGNLRNSLTLIDSFSTLGFQNGIIKYVAENEAENDKVYKVLATVFISILFAIMLLSGILVLFSGYWSSLIFNDHAEYAWVFKVLAFSLPWYTGNIIFIAVLNGLGRYKEVININIWGNVSGVLLSALIIWKLGTTGALLGLIVSPSLMFLFSFYLLHRQFPGYKFLRWKHFSMPVFRNLLSYSYMSVVTAVLGQVVYLTIRNSLINNYSMDEAGYWEGMNRLSMFYLLFITTLLTVYFLPRLTTAKTDAETRDVFFSYYKGIVPFFLAGIVVIYFLRYFIIRLTLSEDFLPTADLFFWQLTGDFLKVCSLILGYEFFAKRMTKAYIATEIMSFATLYFSAQYLIQLYGSKGAVMAHAFTYAIYLLVLVLVFRKKLFRAGVV